jgi:hypothetical protein
MLDRMVRRGFTAEQAAAVAAELGVDLDEEGIDVEAFRQGMEVELEHGRRDPRTNVTDDDPVLTGKIALAHLREYPDYYDRLADMERSAEAERNEYTETTHLWVRFEHQA